MKIAVIGDSLTEGRPGVSFVNILKEKFPRDTFVNLGKPGETVKSLYTRLTKTPLDENYDIAFLWIGVNDVYSKLLSVQAQPVVKDHNEFKEVYEKILDLVRNTSKKVVVVSPAIVGENIDNASNREMKELSSLLEKIVNEHNDIDFFNLHNVFEKQLMSVNSSDFINTNPLKVMVEVLFYKKPSKIDKLSKERGLHLTLDGIHLNSVGAQLVADEYATTIQQLISHERSLQNG